MIESGENDINTKSKNFNKLINSEFSYLQTYYFKRY